MGSGGFLVTFWPYKKYPQGVGARSPHLARVIRQSRTTARAAQAPPWAAKAPQAIEKKKKEASQ